MNDGLHALNSKVNLLCLVSVESLVCSGFFLAVIASRLRFSDVADRVRTFIEKAKVYNFKEEALMAQHELVERQPGRLHDLTVKVSDQIHAAIVALERVNPVMLYMRYFRNAGILVFLSILISSSLFITSVLGWTFIATVGATFVYFNYSRINLSLRAVFLMIRITFARMAMWFLLAALSPFLLWAAIVSLDHKLAALFLALGFVTTGLYIFVWLLLAAHADENFGDIEDGRTMQRTGRWLLVKNSLAFTMLMWGIANAFKQLHLTGADEMILVSLTTAAVLMYFVGYYLSKIRWLGVICGWMLAMMSVGVLFKTFHIDGADEMLLMAVVLVVILAPVLFWKRRSFHALFLRFILISGVLTLMLAAGMFLKLQIAATHRTTTVSKIEDVIHSNTRTFFAAHPDNLPMGLEKSNWYIETYGTRPGYSPVYSALMRNYEFFIETNGESSDTTTLKNVLMVAKQAGRIRSLFGYHDYPFDPGDASAEARILIALGRKDEAVRSLESLLEVAPDEDFKKVIVERLADIKR